MAHYNELIVSASDAGVLALVAGGAQRSVIVVHPNEANAAERRVSVFSPVGRAPLGRKPRAVISVAVPDGRSLNIRVLNRERAATALEEAS